MSTETPSQERLDKGEKTKAASSSETNGISNDAGLAVSNTTTISDGLPISTATTSAPQTNEQQVPEGLMFMPAQAGGAPVHMSFSPFPSGEGSWAPAFDPSIMNATGFGFAAAPGMMPHQHMQNQFYFAGADVGIWGQGDPLSLYLLGPTMAMDQSGSPVALDPTMSGGVDPITGLAHGFTGMALNGTMAGMMPVGQTSVMTSPTGVAPAGVENSSQNSGADVGSSASQNSAPQPEKPKSWAAIAGQPAKPRPPPPPKPQPPPQEIPQELPSRKPQSAGSGGGVGRGGGASQQIKGQSQGGFGGGAGKGRRTHQYQSHAAAGGGKGKGPAPQSDIVGKLLAENKYNPSEMNLDLTNARFFVIKSYSEDDIHRSIKYSIWTSTDHGNRRLEQAFREQKGRGNVYMLFSVNGSGHFCGMAQMMSEVDFNTTTGVWAQDKWKGRFDVKWIYVKDVPNSQLRHIRLENNENKPVTNSRDTQEVPLEKARQVVKIIHTYHHTTSIFDDFEHYEKKQEEEDTRKKPSS